MYESYETLKKQKGECIYILFDWLVNLSYLNSFDIYNYYKNIIFNNEYYQDKNVYNKNT